MKIPDKLYVGTQNDELYLIDRQPDRAAIDYSHEGYPTNVIARFCQNDEDSLAIARRLADSWNAAAPTPPAQEAEPVASLYVSRFLGHFENTQFEYLGDLPDGTYKLYTRPSRYDKQEAEPVGFISQSVIDGLKAGKRVQYWMLPKKNGDDFPDIDVPFYTHAPSDKLRLAAEGAEVALSAFCDGEDWLGTMPGDALKTLRDALKGKS